MTFLNPRLTPLRCLLLAGVFHVVFATGIFLIGHFRLLPSHFDESGIGLTFAIDGTSYKRIALDMLDASNNFGMGVWLWAKAPLHSRLYALSFKLFGRLLGINVLGAEPLNLFYYLAILVCVYVLGREVFSARTGLLAAAIVAVWPSFLLHSTQLIRDPLAILCFLALIVVLVLLLSREFAWRMAIGVGLAGILLVTLFWVVRGNMWNAVLVAIGIALLMLASRLLRERRLIKGNSLALLLIIIAALLVPARFESTALPGVKPPTTPLTIPTSTQVAPAEGVWTRTIKQIADRRAGFRFYKIHASDIDSEVRFYSTGDISRFTPRALVIGFFAPFPNMWLQTGSFGLAGRLLSGFEMLVMYVLYLAVGFCLWQERRNMKMWFLFLVAAIGMLALGLVVVNAGALFRIRYVFWMLLIAIAAEGITKLAHRTVFRT